METPAITVSDIIEEKGNAVVTTEPDTTIAEAARILSENQIGLLVVSDDVNTLAGVISERDIIKAVWQHGDKVAGMQVKDLMTRTLVGCRPETHPQEVLDLMQKKGFRHMPVLGDGKVLGLVGVSDLYRHLLKYVSSEP